MRKSLQLFVIALFCIALVPLATAQNDTRDPAINNTSGEGERASASAQPKLAENEKGLSTGFGSFIVKKRAETIDRAGNPMIAYDIILGDENERAALEGEVITEQEVRGSSFSVGLGRIKCPDGSCSTEVRVSPVNDPPVTARFTPDFLDENTTLLVDRKGLTFHLGVACSEDDGVVVCEKGVSQATFTSADAQITCSRDDADLRCWAESERGETQLLLTSENAKTITHDLDGDGRPDFVSDPDSDGDGLADPVRSRNESNSSAREGPPAFVRELKDATMGNRERRTSQVGSYNAREWNASERASVQAHLRNQTNLTGRDFGLAMAYAMSGNERVREIRYDNETNEVRVEHSQEVRLFGFIPVQARARSTIDEERTIKTDLPWWSFLGIRSRPDLLVSEWDEPATE